ncbi:MAG: hypothetical protein Q8N51_04035 [Gammaproteobacteria bacterium]|nr:hypothetical protein [Gammaproteobacteria bacterium]
MNNHITFDEHQKIAEQVLNLQAGVDRLYCYLYKITVDPTAMPVRRRAANNLMSKVHTVGRASQRVQETAEADLSKQDEDDLRSWPLYYPDDSHVERTNCA